MTAIKKQRLLVTGRLILAASVIGCLAAVIHQQVTLAYLSYIVVLCLNQISWQQFQKELNSSQQRELTTFLQIQKHQQRELNLSHKLEQQEQKFRAMQQQKDIADELVAVIKKELRQVKKQAQEFEECTVEENERLRSEIDRLNNEKQQLTMQYTNTQHQRLATSKQAQEYPSQICQTEVQIKNIDLSKLCIAIVGGHQDIRRNVISELKENYGLQDYIEVPPASQAHLNRSIVRAKISKCDLIAVITRFMDHNLSDIVSSLRKDGVLNGQVLPINCRGKRV